MFLMLGSLGLSEILVLLIMFGVVILPFWMIFQKAGYNGALSLLMFIPLLNVLMIWFLAFSSWPVLRDKNR